MLCVNSKSSKQAVWLSIRYEALQLDGDVSISTLHVCSFPGLQFRKKHCQNVLPFKMRFVFEKCHSAKVKCNVSDKRNKMR